MAAVSPYAKPIGEHEPISDFEKAQEVLQAFYKLQPQLSGIARALTGRDDVSVMPSSGGTYTDNKNIYLSLSPSMILDGEHERRICGKRDGNGLMICEMCKRYEALIVPLYHEMGHIIFGSFAATHPERLAKLLDLFFEKNVLALPDKRIKAVQKRITEKPPKIYIEAAHLVSPYMPPLLNALEDSRVNAGIIGKNPGASKMFVADVANIMEAGCEDAVGRRSMWYDQPENAQFTIGCFLIASKIGVRDGWLSERVTEDLNDEMMQHLLNSIPQSNSAGDVFEATLPVLERGRELGYFITSDDEEPGETGDEGEGTGEAGEDSGMSGEGGSAAGEKGGAEPDDDTDGGSSGDTDDDDTDEGDDGAGGGSGDTDDDDTDEGDDDDTGGGSDTDDDPDDERSKGDGSDSTDGPAGAGRDATEAKPITGTPEEVAELFDAFNPHDEDFGDHENPGETDPQIERALAQEEFEETSKGLFGLDFRDPSHPDFGQCQLRGSRIVMPINIDKQIVQRGLGPLRVAFSENKQSSYDRNRKSGRVNAKVLARRVPFDDQRVFRKKRLPGKRDYHVVIGLDISGSTMGRFDYYSGSSMSLLNAIKTCGALQAEMLSQVGVDFEIYCHTGGMPGGLSGKGSETGAYYSLNIFQIKAINEPWNKKTKDRLSGVTHGRANLDGHTMEFYRKQLDKSDKTDRLIIYYTDGAMPAENYSEELAILQRECRTIKQRGYDVLAVAMNNDDPQKYGLDTVRVNRLEDMQKVVLELQRRLR